MRVRLGQKWMLSALACVAILFLGFAIKGSDMPTVALTLMMFIALLAGLVWLSTGRFEARRGRGVAGVALAFAAFIAVLGFEFYSIASSEAANLAGIRDVSVLYVECLKLGGLSCAFILGFGLSRHDAEGRRFLDMIMGVGGIWAIICFLLYAFDADYRVADMGTLAEGRLHGVFSSPNSAGTLFAVVTVMALVRLMTSMLDVDSAKRLYKILLSGVSPLMLAGLIMLFSLAALIMTQSRGAMFSGGLVFIAVVIIYLWGRPAILRMMSIPAVIIAVVVLFMAPLTHVVARYKDSEHDGWARFRLYEAHFELASRSPWVGYGLGSFNTLNNTLLTPKNYADLSIVRTAHNVYLQWYEDTGLFGLAALALLNAAILAPIVMAAIHYEKKRMSLIMVMAAYTVFLLHGTVDYAFQEPSLAIFISVILGCGFAIATNPNERSPVEPANTAEVGEIC